MRATGRYLLPMGNVTALLLREPSAPPVADTAPIPVIRHITRARLAEMLLRGDAELAVDSQPDDMFLVAMYRGIRFVATLLAEARGHPGEYIGFRFMAWTSAAGEQGPEIAAALANTLPMAQVGVDSEGDLTITQTVALSGGVTVEHLRVQIEFWQQNLKQWSAAIARHPLTDPELVFH